MENWKCIKNTENKYSISDIGNVRNNETNKILKQTINTKGYNTVCIILNKIIYCEYVHRLVAVAFIENFDNLEQVNHKDEIKTNNIANNLEWCTNKYNAMYGTRLEKISNALSKYKIIQYDISGNIIKVWKNKEVLLNEKSINGGAIKSAVGKDTFNRFFNNSYWFKECETFDKFRKAIHNSWKVIHKLYNTVEIFGKKELLNTYKHIDINKLVRQNKSKGFYEDSILKVIKLI